MMIFKKAIPRRTFLRGLGTTLSLPLLEGMVPALAGGANQAARPVSRLTFVYVPNGMIMEKWTPATEGTAFELPPILEPLSRFRDQFLVLSGLNHNAAAALPGEGEQAPHERAGAAYLTGIHPKKEVNLGISLDQIAAQELGKHTQLASLELSLDPSSTSGACEKGWSCAYLHTLSWRTPTTPMPTENQPRAVFERLFGDTNSTNPAERLARIQKNRSILDSVTEAAKRLLTGLSTSDRARITEYIEAIRDVERRIVMAEEQSSRELPEFDRPAGVPARFDEYAKLMFDLQVLAYQCDLTRVCTFMMGPEQGGRTFREIGIGDAHHPLSHHQNDAGKIAKVVKIDIYHSEMVAYFFEKLRSTPDGDGSLLDHSMIVYGSGISDGNSHSTKELPVVLAGGGAGQLKGGRHIRYPKGTPMTNLYLTLLDKLGIPVENFGDSTGKVELISAA
ncbi:MAG: DUF1552 domain-containing protein [Acidobacteria bacterium]|nr:DUF1552 domain-containing protein [Acidobacteriota bacterium]